MKLSKETVDKIENALKHYERYRPAFGRTATEQLDLDDKHQLEIYRALDELRALRMSYGYGDVFGLMDLTPILAPEPHDYKTEAAYLAAVDKFNDFQAQVKADQERSDEPDR